MNWSELLLLPLGLAVSALGTLIGAGGGFILIPIMLFMWPEKDPASLAAISMFMVLLNAISGSIAYGRMGRIDYKTAILFSAVGLPGVYLGSITKRMLSIDQFRLYFGILLVSVAIYLLIRNKPKTSTDPRNLHGFQRTLTERDGTVHYYSYKLLPALIISLFIGFLASLMGIGGGVVQVPVMVQLFSFPVPVATATSQFILGTVALTDTVLNLLHGELQPEWHKAILLAVGAVIGAQVGARLSQRLKGSAVLKVLAVALALTGIRVIAAALGH